MGNPQTAKDTNDLRVIKIGRVFRSVRVEKGLMQEQVAIALGMPRSGVAMLEGGRRSVKLEELFQFCEFVGMKPKDVIERINHA